MQVMLMVLLVKRANGLELNASSIQQTPLLKVFQKLSHLISPNLNVLLILSKDAKIFLSI